MSTIGRTRGKAPGRSVPGYSLNKNNKKVSDEQIKEYIIQIIEDEGYAYGYLKITHALRKNFHLLINKKKVYRLCKELNLLKSQRKIKTKHPRRDEFLGITEFESYAPAYKEVHEFVSRTSWMRRLNVKSRP